MRHAAVRQAMPESGPISIHGEVNDGAAAALDTATPPWPLSTEVVDVGDDATAASHMRHTAQPPSVAVLVPECTSPATDFADEVDGGVSDDDAQFVNTDLGRVIPVLSTTGRMRFAEADAAAVAAMSSTAPSQENGPARGSAGPAAGVDAQRDAPAEDTVLTGRDGTVSWRPSRFHISRMLGGQ